jgi:hypothetical protein
LNNTQAAKPVPNRNNLRLLLISGIFLFSTLILSLGLAWVSSRYLGIQGWPSFLSVVIIGAGILVAGWWLIRVESPPRWLAFLTVLAALLRLGAGVLWYVAMPIWGHESPAEQNGYVMSDASKRDQAAWKLANSNKSLANAFLNNRVADQYGGMLFLSAAMYRYLGDPIQQPLLIVVITASFSSLAVLFTWAFARRAWEPPVANLAAIALAIYPETVLLGSSQMREAFTVTFTVTAFYGLLRYFGNKTWKNLLWIVIPLVLFLPFSPPFAALLLGLVGLSALALRKDAGESTSRKWAWLVILALVLIVLLGLWLALSQFTPQGMTNPVEMVSWWLRKSAEYQARITRLSSGWLQKTFKSTPVWTHIPVLVGYGTLQPFLPAALTVGSNAPIWPKIVLWRSVGWTILLGFLVYAPILAFRTKKTTYFTRVLCLVVWLTIILTAFRGGGDMWDNPRYRAVFTGLQIALAAWAWTEHRRVGDPWLRRALIGLAALLVWFIPWYLRRYTGFKWPVVGLFETLILGIASGLLIIILDWIWMKKRPANQPKISETKSDSKS